MFSKFLGLKSVELGWWEESIKKRCCWSIDVFSSLESWEWELSSCASFFSLVDNELNSGKEEWVW